MNLVTLRWTRPDHPADEIDLDAERWTFTRSDGQLMFASGYPDDPDYTHLELAVYGSLLVQMLDRRAAWLMRRGYVPDGNYDAFNEAVAATEYPAEADCA